MNYNGLSAMHVACPPYDHRTMPVVDMINRILRTLSQQSGVPLIDTTHIMGPLWDSAQDYNHPVGKVFTAEIEWILHALLSSTAHRETLHPLTIESTESESRARPHVSVTTSTLIPIYPDGSVLKFTDNNLLYIVHSGTLHAVTDPSFHARNIRLLDAAEKVRFHMGDPLPVPAPRPSPQPGALRFRIRNSAPRTPTAPTTARPTEDSIVESALTQMHAEKSTEKSNACRHSWSVLRWWWKCTAVDANGT
jgi:hypothetical protein